MLEAVHGQLLAGRYGTYVSCKPCTASSVYGFLGDCTLQARDGARRCAAGVNAFTSTPDIPCALKVKA